MNAIINQVLDELVNAAFVFKDNESDDPHYGTLAMEAAMDKAHKMLEILARQSMERERERRVRSMTPSNC